MTHAILVDTRFEDSAAEGLVLRAEDWSDALGQLLDDGVETVVVVGDDASLAHAATAHAELLRHRTERMQYFLVTAGGPSTVGQLLGSPAASRSTFRKLDRIVDSAREKRVGTLRIVDSAEKAARLGFNVGMGLPYDYWAAYRDGSLGGRLGAAETLARLATESLRDRSVRAVEADVHVDWESRAERFGYLVVSALEWTWFDVKMNNSPAFRLGNSTAELFSSRSRVGRLVQRARGAGAEEFGRIHIDTNTGYVVDGELSASERPRTVAMSAGPTIRCLGT